jgi:hypothetical protein
MTRSERIARMLDILSRIEALGKEYEQLLFEPHSHPITRPFSLDDCMYNHSLPMKSWLSDAVYDCYSEFLDHWPPHTMAEVRSLPRALQSEGLWRFTNQDQHEIFFRVAFLWPNQWSWDISDDPAVKTVEHVHQRRTQLLTARLSSERCMNCGGPIAPDSDFGYGPYDELKTTIVDAECKFTCTQCIPETERELATFKFLRCVVAVKTVTALSKR